jgi:hypothetical protein
MRDIRIKTLTRFAALAAACLMCLNGCGGPEDPAAVGTGAPSIVPAATTGAPETQPPAPPPSPSPTATPKPTGALPEENYELFARVGFAADNGGSPAIGKWSSAIRIQALGKPSAEDAAALGALVKRLKGVRGMPDIGFVTEGGNLKIAFTPRAQAAQADAAFNTTDAAQAHIEWNGCAPASATLFLADEITGREKRDAALAGLLFRGLGLAPDPRNEYAGSALNAEGGPAGPAGRDWTMLALLYSPDVEPGMTEAEAMPAVRAVLPGVAAGPSANDADIRSADLLAYFNEVGFWWASGASDGVACKWAGAVRLQVTGSPTPAQRKLLDDYVERLNQINGFPGIVEVQSDGAFVVDYRPSAELKKAYPNMTAAESCYIAGPTRSGGKIVKCGMGVATDFADENAGRTQFLRLFMKAFGFAYTSEAWPDSILNYRAAPRDWALLDWKMLELLYRPDVKPGTKRAAVMKLLQSELQ